MVGYGATLLTNCDFDLFSNNIEYKTLMESFMIGFLGHPYCVFLATGKLFQSELKITQNCNYPISLC